MIKDFKTFINERYSDDEQESFFEKFEKLATEFEEKMKREGVQLDSFWEDLEELDNEMDFSDDIDEFLNNEYEGTYYGKYNSEFDDREMTPEYHEALKRAEEKYGPTNASDYRSEFNSFTKKRKFVEEYLFRHLIEENWEGYKLVYEKWLEIIKKKNRAKMFAKKHNL